MTKSVVVQTPEGEAEEEKQDYDKIFIGEVPIMLRSSYCSLFEHTDKELTDLGECPYDQVSSQLVSPVLTVWNECGFAAARPLCL